MIDKRKDIWKKLAKIYFGYAQKQTEVECKAFGYGLNMINSGKD